MVVLWIVVGALLGAVVAWLASRRDSLLLKERLAVAEAEAARLKDERREQREQARQTELRLAAAEERNKRLPELEAELRRVQDGNRELGERAAKLETTVAQERRGAEEKLALLGDAKERLTETFKNLANEILESKGKNITEQNKANIEAILKPLGEKLQGFERQVRESHEKGIQERSQLKEQLGNLHKLNERLGVEASNLTNALKGNAKAQGNWGEMILERVLEASGLRKGMEYETQESQLAEDGRRYIPDVLVRLPEGKTIVIDAKVSLLAYERFCAATSDADREQALKEHAQSLRKHVRELSEKDYTKLPGVKTLDFALLFIPVEPAFAAALSLLGDLAYEAFSKNIVIVTPSTLLATLRTIAHIWKYEDQNRNAAEIARQSGALYDKFAAFAADLASLGARLDQAHGCYDEAMRKLSTGKGNLVNRAERIRKLGAAASKRLPAGLVDPEAEDEPADTPEQGELPLLQEQGS